ncbi:MAG: hypothetical protein FJX53_10500 [Alphaproteobacteria bacterium]|nr:hypothetical protein [Alphaproteobacteria bacterium]
MTIPTRSISAPLALLFASILFVTPAATQGPVRVDIHDPALNQGPKKEATGDKVMVSTQLPVVTETALKVLREGGNAVDAMIASVFVQHVHDYHQVSHFGAMSAIGYDAKSNKYWAINAVSMRPLAERGEHGDASKVAIGGVVRGLEALGKKYGTRSWASYLQPGIKAAEEGAIVTTFMFGINYNSWETDTLLKNNPEAAKFYMPDGHLVPVGQRWKMPALAAHMRKLADQGADYMYTGEWAQKFVKEANRRGGRVTMQDMAEYQPIWDEPTKFTYRGRKIYGSPPPDTGGPVVGYNLTVLENFDLKKMGHYAKSTDTLEIMARVAGRAEAETRLAIVDPLNFKVPTDLWISKDYGRMGAEFVRNTMPKVNLGAATTTAALARPGPLFPSVDGQDAEDLGSNHNVIVDAEGNWVSMLHTGHGGAPDVLIDGVKATGSTARAFTKGPGRRLVLPITAIIIAGQDGKPWLAMGTPGSPPQPITQVLVNILDFDMHPGEAADAPRFWAFRGNEQAIEIESRITKETKDGLTARGITVKDLGPYNWHTGSMQIVWRDQATGRLRGVTDPRRLGLAAGF